MFRTHFFFRILLRAVVVYGGTLQENSVVRLFGIKPNNFALAMASRWHFCISVIISALDGKIIVVVRSVSFDVGLLLKRGYVKYGEVP